MKTYHNNNDENMTKNNGNHDKLMVTEMMTNNDRHMTKNMTTHDDKIDDKQHWQENNTNNGRIMTRTQ